MRKLIPNTKGCIIIIITVLLQEFICCSEGAISTTAASSKAAVVADENGNGHPLRAFPPGDPEVRDVRLTDEEKVLSDHIETKRTDDGRIILVQDIHAHTDTVWSRLLDFDQYSSMIPGIVESQIVDSGKTPRRSGGKMKSFTVKIQTKTFSILKQEYKVLYEYHPSQHSITWSATSSVAGTTHPATDASGAITCVGYWHVRPHPRNPEFTRVFHSVDLVSTWSYHWMQQLSNPFCTRGIEWLKKQSEAEANRLHTTTNIEKDSMECSTKQHFGGGSMLLHKIMGGNQTADSCEVSEQQKGVRPIGVARYALVFSVLSLSLYNIYLFIWQ